MDKIINWLLLTIIFVFDPLAIALVVAANFAFEQIRPKTKENLYGETVVVEDKEEFNKNLDNTLDNIGEEEILEELFDRPDKETNSLVWAEDDGRMDVIGQNGNTGEHYEEEVKEEEKEESYVEEGYMAPENLKPQKEDIREEIEEIERIIKRKLTQWEIRDLKESPKTKTFNNDEDDLKITY